MIDLRPFRALHYNPQSVALADVIAPPYDVIGDAELDQLYRRSPYNVVRLILNRAPDRYAAAAAEMSAWRRRGVLVQDREPALYWYVQDFALADGSRCQRSGLIAAVRLEPFAAGNILPHERTFPSAKADRLKLMQACRANLSPIFGVYPGGAGGRDAVGEAAAQSPWIDVEEPGERHRVWRIADPTAIDRIVAGLRGTTVFIADGHHRYETALTYRDERRAGGETNPDAPYNFLLMYLCPMADPGLVILPTHRLWHGVLPAQALEKIAARFEMDAASPADVFARLRADTRPGVVGLHSGGATYVLRLREDARAAVDRILAGVHPVVRGLDVSMLDGVLLADALGIDCARAGQERLLTYTHDDREALAAVDRRDATAAFLLRAPHMHEVEGACRAGQTMPQKSTYFFPKLKSGLVFHLLDGDA